MFVPAAAMISSSFPEVTVCSAIGEEKLLLQRFGDGTGDGAADGDEYGEYLRWVQRRMIPGVF